MDSLIIFIPPVFSIYISIKVWYSQGINRNTSTFLRRNMIMRTFKRAFAFLLTLCMIAALWTGTAATATAAEVTLPDTYVYCFAPNQELIPSYYAFYARHAVCNSPHYVVPHDNSREDATYLFNIVNLPSLIWDEAQAPEGGYASLNGFCADRATPIMGNTRYRRLNLEDAYFCDTDISAARSIRAVMRHTWPHVQDVEQIMADANAYLQERYGEEAQLVQELTGAELLAASQAAIWHYSNNEDFSSPYPYGHTEDFDSWGPLFCEYYYPQMMYLDGFVNIREKQRDVTATNINGIYEYLIGLPGEDAYDRVITEDALTLVGAVQMGEEAMLLVSIDGTVNSDDVLTLTAGSHSWALGSKMEATALSDQLYALPIAADALQFGDQLDLALAGMQTVQDLCFLEAQALDGLTPRQTSQSLVVYGNDAAPVGARKTADIPQSRTLTITKVDAVSKQPLPGVAFDLYMELAGEDVKVTTLTTDNDGKITVDVTDDGTNYYFVESQPLPGYESNESAVSTGTLENIMSTGSLTVTKKVINTTDAKPHEQFSFRLTLDPATAPITQNGLSWLTEEYLSQQLESTQKLNWTVTEDGTLSTEFTLKADGSITVSRIPLGATYKLEELLAPKDRLVYSVTTKIGDGKEQKSDTAQGTIAKQNAVLYTNTLHKEANPQTGDVLLPTALLLTALLTAAWLFRRKPQ